MNFDALIERFEAAVSARAFKGAQPPEDRQAIEEEYVAARDALRERGQTLAAHVERMTAWIKEHGWHADTCDLLDLDEEGKHKSCSCGLGVINDSPETSLAHRDATKQAEALDALADDIERSDERPSAACVRYQAAELRRQAEGGE